MDNQETRNNLLVYRIYNEGSPEKRLQLSASLPTGGNGGAGGNGGSIAFSQARQLVAVVNKKSDSVSVFVVEGDHTVPQPTQVIKTVTGPVSVAFDEEGNHLYVLGAQKVASYFWSGNYQFDPTPEGEVAVPDDTGAQVISTHGMLYWTHRGDDNAMPHPTGQIMYMKLNDGAVISSLIPQSVGSIPVGHNKFPVGFAAVGEHVVVPMAHDGLITVVHDGKLVDSNLTTTQAGACWVSVDPTDNTIWIANTGAKTFSLGRRQGDQFAFLSQAEGIASTTDLNGGPGDIAAYDGYGVAVVHVAKTDAYLTFLRRNNTSLERLASLKMPAASANGVIIIPIGLSPTVN